MKKTQELRNLSRDEVAKKVEELEEELFNLRFQAKMGQLSNALRLRIVRKDVARVKTLINEKRGEKTAAAPKEEARPEVEVKPKEEVKPAGKAKPKEKAKLKKEKVSSK